MVSNWTKFHHVTKSFEYCYFSVLDGVEPVQQPGTDDYQENFITYKYYVKHQRLVADVPISAMSPIPIVCRISDALDVQTDQEIAEQETGELISVVHTPNIKI